MAVSEKCDSLDLRLFAVKTLLQTWYFGDWSSEHEQFAKFVPRYATDTILIGIRVVAKSAGSESPVPSLAETDNSTVKQETLQ
jgi:hypothetical protein